MKKLLLLSILFFIVLSYFSCKSDFELNAEYKDITVVYGLLNQNETEHYIKINRAYIGDNAVNMAQDPNNISYGDSLEVTLEEWYNGNYIRKFDFEDTLIKRDSSSGSFYNPNDPYQIIYKANANLDEKNEYKLIINNKYTGKLVTSQTGLVKDFSIRKPKGGQKFIGFIGTQPTQILWNSGETGRLYQVVVRFYYREKDLNNNETKKYVDWVFGTKKSNDIEGGEEMSIEYIGEEFYKNIKAHIFPNPNVVRIPDTVQFIFSVAADDFNTYMDVNSPSNSIVFERPEYTNINNGIGIFSSRYVKIRNLLLSNSSEDTLVNGQHTSGYGFIKSNQIK